MEFSTSTLGTIMNAAKTELTSQVPDILLWGLIIFGVVLGIGVVFAAFGRARRQTVAAVGGGKRRKG